jgi:ferrochelatase
MSDLIQNELDAFTEEEIKMALDEKPGAKPLHVLFSAHGVPNSYIAAGDPYQKQIQECVDKISKQLYQSPKNENVEIHLSYQSRVGPIEWLRPYTDDVLPDLGQEQGVRNLVVVPISFVSEHIETLEEIDIEYRELAEESGIVNWKRCPALNTDETFIEDMADMVYEALQEPALSVTEACIANRVSDIMDESTVRMAGVQGVGAESGVVADLNTNAYAKNKKELAFTERLNARVAIAGILLTVLVELLNGKSLLQMLGGN